MAAPERVLITADTVGGVWTYALEMARGLIARGLETAMATMGALLSRNQRRELETLPNVAVFESSFPLEWMAQPWEGVRRAGEWLLEIEERFRPDIVHLNQYCFGALPFRAPVLLVGHSCVLSWWQAVHASDAPPEWNRYRSEVARGLQAAALVVAPARAMLWSLEELYGPLRRTAVIPNGRGLPHSTVPKQPFLFAAGRLWDEAKNLSAVEKVAAQIPWPTYIAGPSLDPDGGARSYAACRFLGKLNSRQVAWWMQRASIFVAPARYEPFGLAALEAALTNCALVLGDIPSLHEIWDQDAWFVSPSDCEALYVALYSLIRTPELRHELASKARRRALEFSAERMVEAYCHAYASLGAGVRPLTAS